jgi:hypothetical protein
MQAAVPIFELHLLTLTFDREGIIFHFNFDRFRAKARQFDG